MKYETLLSPIKIGKLTLKNRMISTPSSQNDVGPDGSLTPYNCAYYARKAKGGAAMVTVGDCIVHPSGKNHPNQLLGFTDNSLHSLMRCAESIHQYDSIACCQLSHGGITCNPAFIGGERPWGPSERPVTIGFQTVEQVRTTSRELTEEMMEELAEAYGQAALRAKRSYFDMVQLHSAHGWLMGQFLSPNINRRTDRFGGSIENRCRFALMIIQRIRAYCGKDFPIEIRINGSDFLDDGLQIDETVEICKYLEPYIDSLHISASVHYDPTQQDVMQCPMFAERGHLLKYAAAVKAEVKTIPVTTVGGYSHPDMMEDILTSGKADIIAMGRQLLADPDIAKKVKEGRIGEIRQCLRCGTCQSHRFMNGAIRCAVNPEIGREYEVQFKPPAEGKKRVLIAGGGPGGMQAAITAAKRGHSVTLCEKADRLGGALGFAETVPFKRDLFNLANSMEAELRALQADIRYNTEATPELIAREKPDVLIAAVGAECIRPPFPGIDSKNVVMPEHVDKGAQIGDSVVVIGGGLVGIETAIHLAMKGKKVTVIEMADEYAPDANFRHIQSINRELEKYGVPVETGTKCESIGEDGVRATKKDGSKVFYPADTVVISVGMRPLFKEVENLRGAPAPEFIAIGNCRAAGQVKAAIRAGYDAAINIAAN